jgi:hypothetical protein
MHLTRWTAYCENCTENRRFMLKKERDAETHADYFEYV